MYRNYKKVLSTIMMLGIIFSASGESISDSSIKNGKPNIVIIVSDDQGNADAGYQRNPATVSTPSIDKLALDH